MCAWVIDDRRENRMKQKRDELEIGHRCTQGKDVARQKGRKEKCHVIKNRLRDTAGKLRKKGGRREGGREGDKAGRERGNWKRGDT